MQLCSRMRICKILARFLRNQRKSYAAKKRYDTNNAANDIDAVCFERGTNIIKYIG